MARIHARRRGRSGSNPQTREKNPSWALKPKDVESKVVELSSEGNTTSCNSSNSKAIPTLASNPTSPSRTSNFKLV